jgi:hypothetical protein
MTKPKYTLVLDSSQLTAFMECPQMWYNQYVRRLIPVFKQTGADEPMNAGSFGHALLDRYYKGRAMGNSLNMSVEYAMAFDVDTEYCECGCSIGQHKFIESLNIQECHHCKTCADFKAKPYDLKQETRTIVLNRLREYFFQYQATDILPLTPEHVEVGFSEVIFEDAENLFVLEGRIDLIGQLQGMNCIMDHKFQFKRHFLYPRSIQFKNYCLVSKCLMFMINYIRLHKNPDQFTLQRVLTSFTVPELLNWKKQLVKMFFDIKSARVSGAYERRWSACKGYGETYDTDKPKYCKYNVLCEEYNQDMVQVREQQQFQVSEKIWRPW